MYRNHFLNDRGRIFSQTLFSSFYAELKLRRVLFSWLFFLFKRWVAQLMLEVRDRLCSDMATRFFKRISCTFKGRTWYFSIKPGCFDLFLVKHWKRIFVKFVLFVISAPGISLTYELRFFAVWQNLRLNLTIFRRFYTQLCFRLQDFLMVRLLFHDCFSSRRDWGAGFVVITSGALLVTPNRWSRTKCVLIKKCWTYTLKFDF